MAGADPGWELRWPGKRAPEPTPPAPLYWTDAFHGPPAEAESVRSRLVWGDNLQAMHALLPEFAGKIDLIYLDPPFNARQDFTMTCPVGEDTGIGAAKGEPVPVVAYRDTWADAAYLQMLYERLWLVRELLAESGSLFVHVNWRVGHLVQALLDELFGRGERQAPGRPGFRNEIVWGFGGGGAARNSYRRKHDNLFWYTKGRRWTFHPQYRPYTEKTRQRGLTAVKGPDYALRDEGATLETWWTDPEVQKILSPTARENWKYPTQKPESLLERIVTGHSNPGDLVADFFCGSGTTGAVAERLGRRWLMGDASAPAILVCIKRLSARFDLYRTALPAPAGSLQAEAHGRRVTLTGDLDRIEYWAVDPDYGALVDEERRAVFRHQWQAFRMPAQRTLAATSEPLPLTNHAALKAFDLQGAEYLKPFG
jgi:hypothetical protein